MSFITGPTTRATLAWLCLSAVFIVSANSVAAQAAAAPAPSKPNIIFFLVDDMGYMDCGVYGSKYYETPNMDRFATQAMRFTDAYAQPLCSPTRASLLSGQYNTRHGITTASGHQPPQPPDFKFMPDSAPANKSLISPVSKNYLDPKEVTLAEALHAAGYRTAHIGKWHLGLTEPYWPERQGFDVAFHCHPDPGPPGNYFSPYGVRPSGEPTAAKRVGTITDGPAGEYIVDRVTDEAIKFMEANKGQPFFLNVWQYGVHGPWGHKEAYTREFAKKTDPTGLQGNPIMASMLKSVDESLGRIMQTVDRLGIADNTIIVFNSDNGGNTHSNVPGSDKTERAEGVKSDFMKDWRKWAGDKPPTNNAPLRDGKGTLYEGGTRVPLMWQWANHIKPGTVSHAVVAHIDLYPTLLEMTGVSKPAEQLLDGVSYAAVLRSEKQDIDRKAYFTYFPHQANGGGVWVRSGDWKLIRWFEPGVPPELYNLKDDLGESRNQATQQPQKVAELNALIDQFARDTHATFPRPNPAFTGVAAGKKRAPAAKAAVSPDAAKAAALLKGWVPKGVDVSSTEGGVRLQSDSKSPMIAVTRLAIPGPCEMLIRLRSETGCKGKITWRTVDQADFSAEDQVAEFTAVPSKDWQDVRVQLPVKGSLLHVRLFLPKTDPLDIQSIQVSGQGEGKKSNAWRFGPA